MEIALSEEIYIPLFENGSYIDSFPTSEKAFAKKYPGQLECSCTGDKYRKRENFKRHCNTKIHKKWLVDQAKGDQNPLKRALVAEALVKQQQQIIVRLENEKQQLLSKPIVGNLIDL